MRDELAKRRLDLGAEHFGRVDQFVEEERAVGSERVQHGLGSAAERRRAGRRGERRPERDAPPVDERDRRRGNRGARANALARSGRQPCPGDPAGLARGVEHRRLIALEPGREDFRLPRASRGLESLKHRKDRRQRVRPFKARVAVHMLPVEQKAQKIARSHRLDLGSQTVHGAPMHAGHKTPVAPLLVVHARIEAAAQNRAVRFERRQRGCDGRGLQPERRRERRRRRPDPTLQDGRAEARTAPLRRSRSFRGRSQAARFSARAEHPAIARRNSLTRSAGAQSAAWGAAIRVARPSAASASNHFAHAGSSARLGLGDEAQPKQRVVQLLSVDRIGPGLGAHRCNGLGIELAEIGSALRVVPSPRHHRLRPALFERRVVEEGVGLGRQGLQRQRRRLRQIAADGVDLARFEPAAATARAPRCPSLRAGSRRPPD